jgi:hypothetical protein
VLNYNLQNWSNFVELANSCNDATRRKEKVCPANWDKDLKTSFEKFFKRNSKHENKKKKLPVGRQKVFFRLLKYVRVHWKSGSDQKSTRKFFSRVLTKRHKNNWVVRKYHEITGNEIMQKLREREKNAWGLDFLTFSGNVLL